MDIFYDYIIPAGTSEGSATLDCGKEVSYLLWCGIEHPQNWKFGIADSPETDILTCLQKSDPYLYQESGIFTSEMSEEDFYEFIKERLAHYQEQLSDQSN